MKNAVDAFNEIYCSVIKNIDINILQKTISFDLTLVDGGKTTDHKLKFENCTAFLWVEKMAESNEFNDNYIDCENVFKSLPVVISQVLDYSIDIAVHQYYYKDISRFLVTD